jgi:phosphatidate cytidylyltransferase
VTDTQPTMSARFELPVRTASGVVLGVVAVGAVVGGDILFSTMVALAAIAALQEWHRLINAGHFAREMVATSLAMIAALWLVLVPGGLSLALIAILLGAGIAALMAALRRLPASWPIPWHGFGAFYMGMPVLSLAILHKDPRGPAIIGALFVAIWTADTGALFFGRMIGGPKLARFLSPNKTWAGFWGGAFAAGAAEALYIGLLGGFVLQGALLGVLLALAGHCGDLFESWVKRQFHAKNSGSWIPGHGGILDRIDSLIFAAPVCAILIYLLRFNPLTGSAS